MGPRIYFIHSAALPGVYLNPCVYMSLALIRAWQYQNLYIGISNKAVITIYRYVVLTTVYYAQINLHKSQRMLSL